MYLEPRIEGYPLYYEICPCAADGITVLLLRPCSHSTILSNHILFRYTSIAKTKSDLMTELFFKKSLFYPAF